MAVCVQGPGGLWFVHNIGRMAVRTCMCTVARWPAVRGVHTQTFGCMRTVA